MEENFRRTIVGKDNILIRLEELTKIEKMRQELKNYCNHPKCNECSISKFSRKNKHGSGVYNCEFTDSVRYSDEQIKISYSFLTKN